MSTALKTIMGSESETNDVRVVLTCRDTEHAGGILIRKIPLKGTTPTLIGRASNAGRKTRQATEDNALFECGVMSRSHAQFTLASLNRAVKITDIESRYGTFLNGEKLRPWDSRTLTDGDRLVFGEEVSRADATFKPMLTVVSLYGLEHKSSTTKNTPSNKGTYCLSDHSSSELGFSDNDENSDLSEGVESPPTPSNEQSLNNFDLSTAALQGPVAHNVKDTQYGQPEEDEGFPCNDGPVEDSFDLADFGLEGSDNGYLVMENEENFYSESHSSGESDYEYATESHHAAAGDDADEPGQSEGSQGSQSDAESLSDLAVDAAGSDETTIEAIQDLESKSESTSFSSFNDTNSEGMSGDGIVETLAASTATIEEHLPPAAEAVQEPSNLAEDSEGRTVFTEVPQAVNSISSAEYHTIGGWPVEHDVAHGTSSTEYKKKRKAESDEQSIAVIKSTSTAVQVEGARPHKKAKSNFSKGFAAGSLLTVVSLGSALLTPWADSFVA